MVRKRNSNLSRSTAGARAAKRIRLAKTTEENAERLFRQARRQAALRALETPEERTTRLQKQAARQRRLRALETSRLKQALRQAELRLQQQVYWQRCSEKSIVTFGKFHRYDKNLSEGTVMQDPIEFSPLLESQNIKDSTDEKAQTHCAMKCVSGDGAEEEEKTELAKDYIKKEIYTSNDLKHEESTCELKQEASEEEEIVQNVNLPEFVHCHTGFPVTSSSTLCVKQEPVEEDITIVEEDHNSRECVPTIDCRQEIEEHLDQKFEGNVVDNGEENLEMCYMDCPSSSYVTDPLLLSYENTSKKSTSDLSSALHNNIEEECSSNLKTVADKSDHFLDESRGNSTASENSIDLQVSIEDRCSVNFTPALDEVKLLQEVCETTPGELEKELKSAVPNNCQVIITKTYSKKNPTMHKAYPLLDGPCRDLDSKSQDENVTDSRVKVNPAITLDKEKNFNQTGKFHRSDLSPSKYRCPTLQNKPPCSVNKVGVTPAFILNRFEKNKDIKLNQTFQSQGSNMRPSIRKYPTLLAKPPFSGNKVNIIPGVTLKKLEEYRKKVFDQTRQSPVSKQSLSKVKYIIMLGKPLSSVREVKYNGKYTSKTYEKREKNLSQFGQSQESNTSSSTCKLSGNKVDANRSFTMVTPDENLEKNVNQTAQFQGTNKSSSVDKSPTSQTNPPDNISKNISENEKANSLKPANTLERRKVDVSEWRKKMQSLMDEVRIKIRHKCYIPGCSSDNSNAKLFYFPRNELRTLEWLQRIGVSCTLEKTKDFAHKRVLCSHHFDDDQFKFPDKKKLKSTAVPICMVGLPTQIDDIGCHNES